MSTIHADTLLDADVDPVEAPFADTIASLRQGRTSHPLARIDDSDPGAAVHVKHLSDTVLSFDDEVALAIDRATSEGANETRIRSSMAEINKRLAFIDERLAAGSYDRVTGEFVHNYPQYVRDSLTTERGTLTQELAVSEKTITALREVEREKAETRELQDQAEHIRLDFAGHDRERQRIFDEEVLRAEAQVAAQAYLAKKYLINRN